MKNTFNLPLFVRFRVGKPAGILIFALLINSEDYVINKTGIAIVLLFLLLVTSCDLINKEEDSEVIARVNDSYLTQADIASLVPAGASSEDSVSIVSKHINRWASRKLFVDGAKVNLSASKQGELEELIRTYEDELFSKAYVDAIISRELDTAVALDSARKYYQEKGENFRLSEDLVKLRYIHLAKGNNNLDETRRRFRIFDQEDKEILQDMAIQFKSYSLNDSVWVKAREVYQRIEPLSPENEAGFLKKQNFLQLEDSLGVYLITVEDVKFRNEQAPLEYSLPTIKQILLNKRKLELIKKLEKDITEDAIKNEKFEIYN